MPKQIMGFGPQELSCEVCGIAVRCLPFPGLHILCQTHSKRVSELTREKIEALVNEAITQIKSEVSIV